MILTKDILDEKDKRLRTVCEEVVFPISDEDRKLVADMIEHLTLSQIPEEAEKYDLRPGMGFAAPQMGVNKRYFVVVEELETDEGEKQKFKNHIVFNPKIVSESEEFIFAASGEGCLSVNRDVEGIVPRHARITIEAQDMDGNHIKLRAREEVAIAYQHEIDHLNGILFFDHIDPKNPYKDMDNLREL